MNKDPFYKAGRILKAQGLKGSVSISLLEPDLFQTYAFETVFIDPGGGLVPYFVKSFFFTPGKNQLILELEDVTDLAATAKLLNKEVFLASDSLPKAGGADFYTDELLGFRVEDEIHGVLGLLEEVLEMPMQRIFRVLEKEREILIPAVPEFIRTIDRVNKVILLKAPEGLIDIYLGNKGKEEEEE
ncbi:MAG: ribosome maturation factor RimM [Bacteroidia bacterium]